MSVGISINFRLMVGQVAFIEHFVLMVRKEQVEINKQKIRRRPICVSESRRNRFRIPKSELLRIHIVPFLVILL